jgi:hypothetical protein
MMPRSMHPSHRGRRPAPCASMSSALPDLLITLKILLTRCLHPYTTLLVAHHLNILLLGTHDHDRAPGLGRGPDGHDGLVAHEGGHFGGLAAKWLHGGRRDTPPQVAFLIPGSGGVHNANWPKSSPGQIRKQPLPAGYLSAASTPLTTSPLPTALHTQPTETRAAATS